MIQTLTLIEWKPCQVTKNPRGQNSSKDPDVHVLGGWLPATKTQPPPKKTECDYLSGCIKNGHIHKNLNQNGEPQR